MASLRLMRADELCLLPHPTTTSQSSAFGTPSRARRAQFSASRNWSKFRVLSSIREREAAVKESERERNGRVPLVRVPVPDLEDSGQESSSLVGEVGFDWKWPPWKNLAQRYKLIGTTSLAFVICNMDKVKMKMEHLVLAVPFFSFEVDR